MNTYFILGVVLAIAALANTDTEPNYREARLGLFNRGWGWKRPAVETVFITYPKKGWGWKSGGGHGPAIHHYPSHGGGHGWGGWGWQPQKHIHLPGGHFEEPGWGWEGGYSKKAAKAHKKAHKKGYGGGHGHGGPGWGWGGHQQQGWGWQDPWQGWERSDVPTSEEVARILPEVEDSAEGPYSGEYPYQPEYAQQYGDDYK